MPLYIDGTKMPNPSFNAISCSDEKVWSSNTGRSKSAYMNGSIVQVKKTRLGGRTHQPRSAHTIRISPAAASTAHTIIQIIPHPSALVYAARGRAVTSLL